MISDCQSIAGMQSRSIAEALDALVREDLLSPAEREIVHRKNDYSILPNVRAVAWRVSTNPTHVPH